MTENEQKLTNEVRELKSQVEDLGFKLFAKTGASSKEIRNAVLKNPSSLNVNDAWHVDSSGNMWWGNYATYALATIKISAAGSADLSIASFTGSITGATISTSTFTGGTIQTATSGQRVVLDGTDFLQFYDASNLIGQIYAEAGLLTIFCNGAPASQITLVQGAVYLTAGDDELALTGGEFYPNITNAISLGSPTLAYDKLYLSDGTDEWAITINTAGTLITTKQ